METQSKNKLLYTLIIILVILNLGTLSFMWYSKLNRPRPDMMPPPPPRSGMDFLNEELKFTKDQNEKIEKLRDEHFQKVKKIREEGKQLHEAFFDNLSKPDADTNKINEIANQIGLNQKRIELATYYHFAAVRSLCDDKQKTKFDSIIQDILRMGPGGPPQGAPGMNPPPRPDGYKQRDGDGHVNPPGVPGQDEHRPPPR